MKNVKGFALGFVLALGLAVAGAGFAQSTAQADLNKKHESCCSMESCCCKGGSCSMKHGDKQHAQKADGKEHSHKEGCCCCSGDSCNVRVKNKETVN
jgi:hypothetical protein